MATVPRNPATLVLRLVMTACMFVSFVLLWVRESVTRRANEAARCWLGAERAPPCVAEEAVEHRAIWQSFEESMRPAMTLPNRSTV